MQATVMSFVNFEGGVGKTATTALVSYHLSKLGHKVLDIDFDAQGNITSSLLETKAGVSSNISIDKTLMDAIEDQIPLNEIAIEIKKNLALIPSTTGFSMYLNYLKQNSVQEQDPVSFFKTLIEPLREQYDFIFIDVPPTQKILNDTILNACDQVIPVFQSNSLLGVESFITYQKDYLADGIYSPVNVLGFLPILGKNSEKNKEILNAAVEKFGSYNIFDYKIPFKNYIKRMDMNGITDNTNDSEEPLVHDVFANVATEIIHRLEKIEA